MRIYLDMCCYNRPYDDQTQIRVALEAHAKLYIQNLIKEKKYQLVGSYTLDYEVSKNPFPMRRRAIQRFIRENIQAYVGEERSDMISAMVEEIMQAGIKEKDAYHVASAIYAKCAYFISTDIRLLKYKTDQIRMVTPIDFIAETEGEQCL